MGNSWGVVKRRYWLRLLAAWAVVAALALGLPGAPALAAPRDLTGSWINPADPSAPPWLLDASLDLGELSGSWAGGTGHSGLVGTFKAALNGSGTTYTGTFNVTEGSNFAAGPITFTIETPDRLSVAMQSTSCGSCNMAPRTFTLERVHRTLRLTVNGEAFTRVRAGTSVRLLATLQPRFESLDEARGWHVYIYGRRAGSNNSAEERFCGLHSTFGTGIAYAPCDKTVEKPSPGKYYFQAVVSRELWNPNNPLFPLRQYLVKSKVVTVTWT